MHCTILKVVNHEINYYIKIKFPNSFLTFIDSVRSFYSRRYSNYMLDKSSFLARITTVSILSVCFGSIAWICFVKTDQIIIAQGKLIPFGQVKEIRAPENAVITKLLVSEGKKLERMTLLLSLIMRLLSLHSPKF